MLAAWAIEALFGWPDWLFRSIRHPVVWIGRSATTCERAFNRLTWSHKARYSAGALSSLVVIAGAAFVAAAASHFLPDTGTGTAIEAVLASSMIASRSLYTHVLAVFRALCEGNIEYARSAVADIVGRDTNEMNEADIARAGLESLAENASDGVIAPLFWGAIFGLPGLTAYKAINTLDSMFGHRTARYGAFGGFAARLDDLVNFVPARLTGLFFSMASFNWKTFQIMVRDGRRHRSPNAGWPEAAMAGALGVRLSGPRRYGDKMSADAWLNAAARDPKAGDIKNGLRLYSFAMGIGALLLASILFIGATS